MALYRGHLQKAGRSLPSLFYTSLHLLLKQTPAPSHSLHRLPVLQGGEGSAGLPATLAHLSKTMLPFSRIFLVDHWNVMILEPHKLQEHILAMHVCANTDKSSTGRVQTEML